MGAYVNPPDGDKIKWLQENGEKSELTDSLFQESKKLNCLPVVVLDNGMFIAAGIAYSESEYEEFTRFDGRYKEGWKVPIEKLHEVSPELSRYMK